MRRFISFPDERRRPVRAEMWVDVVGFTVNSFSPDCTDCAHRRSADSSNEYGLDGVKGKSRRPRHVTMASRNRRTWRQNLDVYGSRITFGCSRWPYTI